MSLSFPTSSPAWIAAGWTMVHLAWIGAAIGLSGAALRRLLRSARPELRYVVSLSGLAALTLATIAVFVREYEPIEAPRIETVTIASDVPRTEGHTSLVELRRERITPPPVMAAELPRPSPARRLEALVAWLPAVWLSGSLLTFAIVGLGLIGLGRMRRSSRDVFEDDLPRRARVLAESLGIARTFGIAVCDRLTTPILMGIVRPIILLPPAALSGWGVDQLEMALLHELAHLRRHDNLINLVQCVVESLLFFHPVTWWLSSWVRLERESCCDRLVIERTGRSRAYAEMLAGLATQGGMRTASAMAERPVTTRIRRILNLEDRPMRLTVPEGFGLISAALVAVTLALGAHASPMEEPEVKGKARPVVKADETTRKMLREAAEKVAVVKVNQRRFDGRGDALLDIASAQLAVGDREAAVKTLHMAGVATVEDAKLAGVPVEIVAMLTHLKAAGVWNKAGDSDSARAAMLKAEGLLPNMDDLGARLLFNLKIQALIVMMEGFTPDMAGAAPAYWVEMCANLIEARLGLGDLKEARDLCHRAVAATRSFTFPEKPLMISSLGSYLARAGDREAGLALIEEGRLGALALPEKDRDNFLPYVARALSEAGDPDAALALAKTMSASGQRIVARQMLEAVSTDDRESGFAWLDPAGIKILIGASGTKPNDLVVARRELPGIARRIKGIGDAKSQSRTLSTIAELQSQCGDLDGAKETARSLPVLRRSDFPGKKDGYYDSVKPGTLAKVAVTLAKGGDAAGSSELFREAEVMARAIEIEEERMIAQIVLAGSYAQVGDKAKSLTVIREAIPLAKTQPEPRRSRGLAMLASGQVKAGDVDGALATSVLIRDYPGLEKARALGAIADVHEKSGDAKAAEAMNRRAIALLEAAPPDDAKLGETMKKQGIARGTFVDYDLEFRPDVAKLHREQAAGLLHVRLGDRTAKRNASLAALAGQAAQKGDVDGAVKLAESIEDAHEKLSAYQQVAIAIRDARQAK